MVSHAPFHPHTPSSGTVFLVLGMHKVLLCLSLVSLSLHPGGIPRHQARPSPSRNGGKLIANTTEKPNFGCCVLGPCFLHRCVSCNTSCRWVFQTKTRKKKGIPQFPFPPGELPSGCSPARLQHILHHCCLSYLTLVLFTSEIIGER